MSEAVGFTWHQPAAFAAAQGADAAVPSALNGWIAQRAYAPGGSLQPVALLEITRWVHGIACALGRAGQDDVARLGEDLGDLLWRGLSGLAERLDVDAAMANEQLKRRVAHADKVAETLGDKPGQTQQARDAARAEAADC